MARKKIPDNIRKGYTPRDAEDILDLVKTMAPAFETKEDFNAFAVPLLAQTFFDELQDGIPALADGVPSHLEELLQPGCLAWSLWEALNPRLPDWMREETFREIRKKIRAPIVGKRWKGIGHRIKSAIREDHPDLPYRAALDLRVMQALYHASEKVLSLLPGNPMDPKGVLRRLKNTMSDHAVPEEILGPHWEKEEGIPPENDNAEEEAAPSVDVFAPRQLGEADVDRVFEELAGRCDLTPMERDVFLTVWKKEATDKEAAGILGISEGAVRLRLHKARQKLKAALKKEI